MGTYVTKALFKFHLDEFTGRVTLEKEQVRRTILFQKGIPLAVESSLRSETLGQILLRQKRITDDQYLASLIQAQETGRNQGEVIAELGYLTAFDVFESLRAQAEQIVHSCFLLDRAVLIVEEGESYLVEAQVLPIDFFRMFLYTSYLTYALEPGNPLFEDAPIRLTKRGQGYLKRQTLRPIESKIVQVLDGNKTFQAALATMPDHQTEGVALIEALRSVDLIEYLEAPTLESSPAKVEDSRKIEIPTKQLDRELVAKPSEVRVDNGASSTLPIYKWALKLNRPYEELLGVPLTTPATLVRSTYERILKELNLLAIRENYEQQDRETAELVLDRLTLAMTVLTEEGRRKSYVQDLRSKEGHEKEPSQLTRAEVFAHKAKLDLEKKRYTDAWEKLQKAVELNPKEPSYLFEMAEILKQKALADKTGFPSQIVYKLNKALELDDSYHPAHFVLGTLAKLRGDLETARKHFRRVVEIDPSHERAFSELRQLEKYFQDREPSAAWTRKLKILFAGGILALVGLLIWSLLPKQADMKLLALPIKVTKLRIRNQELEVRTVRADWESLTMEQKSEILAKVEVFSRTELVRQAKILDEEGHTLGALMAAEARGSKRTYSPRIVR